jgi:hypothetical protein
VKILLDTDVLLDVALRRASFIPDSAQVLKWAESAPGQSAVALHSLANLAYLVRPDARSFIRDLLQFVDVPALSTRHVQQAVGFPMADFEDALQAASALAFGASFIITRNLHDFRRSPVPAMSPAQFLAHLKPASGGD